MVQKKLPSINSVHGSETRNIINEIIKAINDRGLEILSESGFLTWLEKNGIKHREEVATFADLPSSDSLNTVRGVSDDNKIYIKKENGWLPFQSVDISKINHVERKVEDISVNIKDFILDGETSTDNALTKALNYLDISGGGKVIYPVNADGYVLNNVTTSVSNVEIDFMGNEVRKESGTGYQVRWEGADIKNIKISNYHGKGDNTQITNAGLGFAMSEGSHLDGLTLINCKAEEFAQYGIGIGRVSNINVLGDTRIINHGSIHANSTIGIGFFIYPRTSEKNGYIERIYSQINPKSTLTSAAIKLQVITNLQVGALHGVNGRESCISLDAINESTVRNIILESEYTTGGNPGLVFGSNNALGLSSNASFEINGVKSIGDFSSTISFSIGSPEKVTLKDVYVPDGRITASNHSKIKDCIIENIVAQDFRLDIYEGSTLTDSHLSNIKVTKGAFTLTGEGNKLTGIKSENAGSITIKGNNNEIVDSESSFSNANGFSIDGDNNYIIGGFSKYPTIRQAVIKGDSNRVLGFKTEGDSIVLDSGTNTIINIEKMDMSVNYGTAAPVMRTWKKGDRMINTDPAPGKPAEWICTEGGTPGTWESVGLIDIKTLVPLDDSEATSIEMMRASHNALLLRLRNSGLLQK